MKVAIVGAGGFAREVSSYLDCEVQFYVDDQFAQPSLNIQQLSSLDVEEYKVLIAIGDSKLRSDILTRIPSGAVFHSLIHERAYVGSNVILGEGAIVCPGAVITTNVKVGAHAQMHVNSIVGHDCEIGEFATISPGAVISGTNKIEDRVYFGSNSTSKQGIKITSDVVVGLNAGVVSDIGEPGVYVGTPAKKLK